jgi:hypothetical protein
LAEAETLEDGGEGEDPQEVGGLGEVSGVSRGKLSAREAWWNTRERVGA